MLRSDLCNYNDAYIVAKFGKKLNALIMPTEEMKTQPSKTMLHLGHEYQKSITHSQTMQKILILLFGCIIF